MVDIVAQRGASLLEEPDASRREVTAVYALAHLAEPMWLRHPKALSGVVDLLTMHDNPGGPALVVTAAPFMPGKLGELLRPMRQLLLIADPTRERLVPREAPRAVEYLYFEPTDVVRESDTEQAMLACRFERDGQEFGWLLGLEEANCGAVCMFEPIPYEVMRSQKSKLFGESGTELNMVPELDEPVTRTVRLTNDQGRWMVESALQALETHRFEPSEAAAAMLERTERDMLPSSYPAMTALVRWHLAASGAPLARRLPAHGKHLPFVPW